MNQLNSVIIEGNITRTPELREPKDGFKVCTIPIAVNRFYRNSKGDGMNEVSYFNVETYGKMAEVCMEKCNKGRGMRVVGRLKQSRWKNSEGKQTSKVSIIAEHIEFKKQTAPVETAADFKAMEEANNASIESELMQEQEDIEQISDESEDKVLEEITEEEVVY
ncbi:MAG: single-stranded DNA-binding protein [Treponemataceae bacterium]|nr:single-stranded DNA-binding protein [Treponemataceae bacterium]